MHGSWRGLRVLAVALFLIASVAFACATLLLRASLPALTGEIAIDGLAGPVSVARDVLGRPVITAGNWPDLARAMGFVHAQERFFQMDMARRSAAGELAALFGTGALALDKSRRMHRLRALAVDRLTTLDARERELIEAYAVGVNAGLAALRAKPFEYWLLAAPAAKWRNEDLLLVVYAMYFELTDEMAGQDAMFTTLRDVYPPDYFAFLSQEGTSWDAPIEGSVRSPLVIPGADVYQLPREGNAAANLGLPAVDEGAGPALVGSNNWALHGSRTESGIALLANDMHLGLGLPNIWYQARLVITDATNTRPTVDVTGVTLPGTIGVIVGSNGSVAWGFTNSYGDWSDRVLLEVDPQDPSRYRAGAEWEALAQYQETIDVKGAPPVEITYAWTRWGPLVGEDHLGRLHALKWLAHEPLAVNSRIIDLAGAGSVEEAMRIANTVGAPPQNFVSVDRKGNIGWTIMGQIPRRVGYDPRFAASWADVGVGWQGWLPAEEYPRIINPPGGQIWTANARVVDGDWLALIGDSGYDLGARAGQVRDGLRTLRVATERDMLAIQLDDRAVFLERWRNLLLGLLDDAALAGKPERAELRALIADWKPRASADSAGFRMVRAFRSFMLDAVFEALTAEARRAAPAMSFWNNQWEGALWALLEQQPAHLLAPQFTSWRTWQLQVVDNTIKYFVDRYPGPLSQRIWGERNLVRVSHPLSQFVPGLGYFIDMPALALPGDNNMPRVQSPDFGASERLAVSPGRESHGYLHMPGGQSGHPLSPYYGSQHSAWARGEPLPFLPGPPQSVLTLIPGS